MHEKPLSISPDVMKPLQSMSRILYHMLYSKCLCCIVNVAMPQIMVDGAHIRRHVAQIHPQACPIASMVSTAPVGSSVRLSARHSKLPSY
jgi:hypothetical protein